VKTFDVLIAIEHTGSGSAGIPPAKQPEFISLLQQGDPKPVRLDWSDMRRNYQTVVHYRIEADNQFAAMAVGKQLFERVLRPQLERFQAKLGSLEVEQATS
jgi:hypothetical protein